MQEEVRQAVPLLALALLEFSGCTVGPKYRPPVVEVPPAYKEAGDWKAAQPNEQNLGGAWWTIFQDAQLDALELQVNVSNQNLKAAEAQYRQARAALRYYRADYYPTVTAGLSAARTRVSANSPTSSALHGVSYNDFVLPLNLSYQADVWGRVRRTVESYRGQAQASAADLATVNLSMHADLAIDYFQARSLDAQEQLLNSTVKQYEQAVDLTQSLYQGGIASEVDLQQATTQLQATRAAAIDVGVLRSQYEHAVAILIGKPPAEFSLPPLPLRHTLRSACLRNCWNGVRTSLPRREGWRLPTQRSGWRNRPTTRSSIWAPQEDLKAPASPH